MEQFLKDWTPTPESTHAALRVPANAGPVDFKLRITPGALEPGKQTVLLTAVTDAWRGLKGPLSAGHAMLAPRFWMLWQIKVFAAHGGAVVEMDGRGPEKREVEPLRSRLRWDDGRGLQPEGSNPYDVAVTYNAASGALSILRAAESLTGTTFLKTTEPWTLLVGKPPSFIDDLASPAGWNFDLAWEIPGRTGPGEPPPPVKPEIDAAEMYLREIETAVAKLRALKGDA